MEEQLEYVGFWRRVLASIIDSLLIGMITLPLLLAFYGIAYLSSDNFIDGPIDFLVSYVLPAVAIILFWVWKQATPGKMAISAKIVDAKTGKEPSLGQYIVRYLSYFVSLLPLCLGFLWVAFDSKKQGWHDKIAGTVVIGPKKKTEDVSFIKS